jgi:putative peptidoglycan lipid II flippase
MLFVRFLSAMKRNEVLLYGSTISVILNVAFNVLFIKYWGLPGIALSTSCVYVISFLFVGINTIRIMSRALSSDAAATEQNGSLVEASELSR